MTKLWQKSVWGVNEKHGLLAHRFFWICVLGPIFLATLLAWVYGLFSLPLDRSLSGVEYFYQKAKVFLAIAALSIPIGATFSRIHNSSQTARNIISSSEQNNFRNGMDHAQFFKEQLSSHCIGGDYGMAAFDMNKDPYFHYKILFPDSMSGSFKNNELEKIVDQLLICISQHCSEPGSISGAKEINDKIEEIFQYLEIPIIFGDHRERARFMTKRDRMAEEASIEVTENIAETLHLYRVISDVKSPLEVWKIGLDLVDHDMAYFINTAITIIGSYDDNFLSKVVQKLDFDSLEGLDKEEADRHLYKEYRECLSSYASKGIKIKKWVDSMTTI